MQHGMNARITVLAHPARDVDKPPRVLVFGPPVAGGGAGVFVDLSYSAPRCQSDMLVLARTQPDDE